MSLLVCSFSRSYHPFSVADRADTLLVRSVLHAHPAGGDPCAFAAVTGATIVSFTYIAEESALALAVTTPVGIVDLHFGEFVSEFMHVSGVIAVNGTGSGFVTCAVTLVAVLEARAAATQAFAFGVVSVEYMVALAVTLGTEGSAHASAHMAGRLA